MQYIDRGGSLTDFPDTTSDHVLKFHHLNLCICDLMEILD
jgi:hypothetical protein